MDAEYINHITTLFMKQPIKAWWLYAGRKLNKFEFETCYAANDVKCCSLLDEGKTIDVSSKLKIRYDSHV